MKSDRRVRISVFIEELPQSIHGMVSPMDINNESYIIVLNTADNEEEQRKAFLHEMSHIWNRDFESREDVSQIEARTHRQMELKGES